MNKARHKRYEKATSASMTPCDSRRLRQVGRGLLALLLISSVMVMFGCGGDDGDDGGVPVDARIADPNSVFALFAAAGDAGFEFSQGLFGPNGQRSFSPTRLNFFNVNFQATPPVGRFRTTPSDPTETEGEGDSDGGASCNYLYTAEVNKIRCPLCTVVCQSDGNIPFGEEGPGTCTLHLDVQDTAETRANPAFQSTPFPVTLRLDNFGTIISINNVSVIPES